MKIELLKEELAKKKMKQSDLAKLAGVTPATVSRILNGQRSCTTEMAKKIKNALKLSPTKAASIFFED